MRSLRPLLVALVLTGCITVGHRFPVETVPALSIGTTTQADIQRIFGTPFRTGVENGDATWTYVNYKLRVFGQPCTQDLTVRFGNDGKLKSFTYNTSTSGYCD